MNMLDFTKEIPSFLIAHKTIIVAIFAFIFGFLSRIAETSIKDRMERKRDLKEKVSPTIDVLKKIKSSFPQKIETKEIVIVRDLLSRREKNEFDSVIDDLNAYNSIPRLDGENRQKTLKIFFDEKVVVGVEKILSILK